MLLISSLLTINCKIVPNKKGIVAIWLQEEDISSSVLWVFYGSQVLAQTLKPQHCKMYVTFTVLLVRSCQANTILRLKAIKDTLCNVTPYRNLFQEVIFQTEPSVCCLLLSGSSNHPSAADGRRREVKTTRSRDS